MPIMPKMIAGPRAAEQQEREDVGELVDKLRRTLQRTSSASMHRRERADGRPADGAGRGS